MRNEPKTILIVEDNADEEVLILKAMSQCGYIDRVAVCRDGEEAIQYLRRHSDPLDGCHSLLPKLFILDLKLPKVSGIELLKEIRSNKATRFTPVVMLTSSNDSKDVEAAILNGANSYVRKPLDFDSFIETVRHIGLYWLSMNLSPNQASPSEPDHAAPASA